MLEMALAAVLVTVALVAMGGRSSAIAETALAPLANLVDDGADLPCPWCRAQTSEADDHCNSCGQKFG